jgi:choline-sulfatase
MNYDDYFDDDKRRKARAAYFGLCSFLDDNIGKVLSALEDSGQAGNTTILYTSDHGELLGNHGMWTKCVMFEEAAAIPMIASGPGIPAGNVCHTATSLVDCYPTIIENVGIKLSSDENSLPGVSLSRIANGEKPDRTLLSEYHDGGSITGMFMIRHQQWKYIHYPGYPPQLFDLANDLWESNDLGESDKHRGVLTECEKRLREIVDPDAANELAFSNQQKRIDELGGREAILAMEDYDHTLVVAS